MSDKSCTISSMSYLPVEICDGIHAGFAVNALQELYGLQAATLAAWCAIEARGNGDVDRYRFWFSIFCDLRKASPVYPLMIPSAFENNLLSSESKQLVPIAPDYDLTALLGSKNITDLIVRGIRSIVIN